MFSVPFIFKIPFYFLTSASPEWCSLISQWGYMFLLGFCPHNTICRSGSILLQEHKRAVAGGSRCFPPHLGVHSSPDLPACLHCPAPAELVFMVYPNFTPHLSSSSFQIRTLSTVLIYKCPWLLQSTLSLSGYHRMLWTFPRRCYSSYDRECSLSSYAHYSHLPEWCISADLLNVYLQWLNLKSSSLVGGKSNRYCKSHNWSTVPWTLEKMNT